MELRLHPLYRKGLLFILVIGPLGWLLLTTDGQRRSDLVLLSLLGKEEMNLAVEQLVGGIRQAQFQGLFPDLHFRCDEGENPFGDRLCVAEIGAFNGVPARAATLFLQGNRLQALKIHYRRAYHEYLQAQLAARLGKPDQEGVPAVFSWPVRDGRLVLPVTAPDREREAALFWLSRQAMVRLRAARLSFPTTWRSSDGKRRLS